MQVLEADKIGSATSPLNLTKTVSVTREHNAPRPGDVVVVKALGESVTYGNLELPSGRLAKINRNDVLIGVLGRRRALKGFVGDVPATVKAGDKLHLLNMGGVIGVCKGHHSSFSDAIEVEVLGIGVVNECGSPRVNGRSQRVNGRSPRVNGRSPRVNGRSPRVSKGVTRSQSENVNEHETAESFSRGSIAPLLTRGLLPRILNIGDCALKPCEYLEKSAPIVIVAGTCMNSGKTVAATEIVKQSHHAGLKVAGAKLSGIACLRDTINMQDSGAKWTASFLDCGLPSTVDCENLPSVAKSILNHLNSFEPDLIVVELGDGIVGGYAVDSVLQDLDIRNAISSFVFCANDYVGVVGGITVLKNLGITIDVVAGSVTDSQMGEDFVQDEYGIKAGNARRDGSRLFSLIQTGMDRINRMVKPNLYPEHPVHPC